jgi:hypothetical protein
MVILCSEVQFLGCFRPFRRLGVLNETVKNYRNCQSFQFND